LQRQGRTGRHGDGKVIYLVTAGQEEERFNKSAQAMKKLHAQLKEADRYFSLSESVVRMLPREFMPKLCHVLLREHGSDKIQGEEVPLAVRLDQIRQEIEKKTQEVSMDAILPKAVQQPVQTSHNQSSAMDEEANPICRKRQKFLLDSQSPNSFTKGSSPLSLEALSIIERVGKTPGSNEINMPGKKFSRLCKARDFNEKVSETFPEKKSNVKKQRVSTRFIDAEAALSGSDSGEEPYDDSDAQEFLNDFIHDGTPESDSMIVGSSEEGKRMPMPHITGSPSPGQLMNFIRSRKRGILLSQSQSFRATPDEYDIADSFINDSSVDFESSDDALLNH
jgi:superfamily II DNA/RNA helicase